MSELDAYHEAGHAYVATLLGGRVVHVSIDPEDDPDDSTRPRRSGETEIRWSRRLTERELCDLGVRVALAGPVVEMLYTGDPFHPGLVAEWSQDWHMAWQLAGSLQPSEQGRLDWLEGVTRQLYRQLDSEPHWSAVAALADHLLAHDTLEQDEVRSIIAEWI